MSEQTDTNMAPSEITDEQKSPDTGSGCPFSEKADKLIKEAAAKAGPNSPDQNDIQHKSSEDEKDEVEKLEKEEPKEDSPLLQDSLHQLEKGSMENISKDALLEGSGYADLKVSNESLPQSIADGGKEVEFHAPIAEDGVVNRNEPELHQEEIEEQENIKEESENLTETEIAMSKSDTLDIRDMPVLETTFTDDNKVAFVTANDDSPEIKRSKSTAVDVKDNKGKSKNGDKSGKNSKTSKKDNENMNTKSILKQVKSPNTEPAVIEVSDEGRDVRHVPLHRDQSTTTPAVIEMDSPESDEQYDGPYYRSQGTVTEERGVLRPVKGPNKPARLATYTEYRPYKEDVPLVASSDKKKSGRRSQERERFRREESPIAAARARSRAEAHAGERHGKHPIDDRTLASMTPAEAKSWKIILDQERKLEHEEERSPRTNFKSRASLESSSDSLDKTLNTKIHQPKTSSKSSKVATAHEPILKQPKPRTKVHVYANDDEDAIDSPPSPTPRKWHPSDERARAPSPSEDEDEQHDVHTRRSGFLTKLKNLSARAQAPGKKNKKKPRNHGGGTTHAPMPNSAKLTDTIHVESVESVAEDVYVDLQDRDPCDLNEHVSVARFEEVIGEPDDLRTTDSVWNTSGSAFDCGRSCCYSCLAFICAIPLAFCWGCSFACASFSQIWEITPAYIIGACRQARRPNNDMERGDGTDRVDTNNEVVPLMTTVTISDEPPETPKRKEDITEKVAVTVDAGEVPTTKQSEV